MSSARRRSLGKMKEGEEGAGEGRSREGSERRREGGREKRKRESSPGKEAGAGPLFLLALKSRSSELSPPGEATAAPRAGGRARGALASRARGCGPGARVPRRAWLGPRVPALCGPRCGGAAGSDPALSSPGAGAGAAASRARRMSTFVPNKRVTVSAKLPSNCL